MIVVAILLLIASMGAMIGVGVSLLCQSCKKEKKYSFEEIKTSKYIREIVEKVDNLSELVNAVDIDLREYIHDELEDLSLDLEEDKSMLCRKINELKPYMKKKRKRR